MKQEIRFYQLFLDVLRCDLDKHFFDVDMLKDYITDSCVSAIKAIAANNREEALVNFNIGLMMFVQTPMFLETYGYAGSVIFFLDMSYWANETLTND